MTVTLFEDKGDVSLVEETLFAEICFSDRVPDFLTFACSTNHGPRLLAKFAHLELRVVSQTGKSLRIVYASHSASHSARDGIGVLTREWIT